MSVLPPTCSADLPGLPVAPLLPGRTGRASALGGRKVPGVRQDPQWGAAASVVMGAWASPAAAASDTGGDWFTWIGAVVGLVILAGVAFWVGRRSARAGDLEVDGPGTQAWVPPPPPARPSPEPSAWLASALQGVPEDVRDVAQELEDGEEELVQGWLVRRAGPCWVLQSPSVAEPASGGGHPVVSANPGPSPGEDFVASVCDDLRAPLRRVDGYARILMEDFAAPLGADGMHIVERIATAGAQLGTLIDDLTLIGQVSSQPLSWQVVDVSQLAEWVVDDLRREHPDRDALATIEPGLQAQGDPTLLRLLLEHLLGRAWDRSRRDDEVQVVLASASLDGEPGFLVEADGLGSLDSDSLFGSLQRLPHAAQTSRLGLGLAVAHRIVQRHGGRLSTAGEGESGQRLWFSLGRTPQS